MSLREDDIRFDRLVDGELSPQEYRELLAACEAQPDGWRRCALAFLEAQAWGGHFQTLAKMTEEPAPAAVAPPVAPSRRAQWPKLLLAMAASFLIAFGLGALVNEFRNPNDTQVSPPLAGQQAQPGPSQLAQDQSASPALRSSQPRGDMTLVTFDGREINLPVYDAAELPETWGQPGAAIPPDVREALERNGHQLRQQRRMIAVPLQNGRGMLAPVDEVEIVPVSARAYQ